MVRAYYQDQSTAEDLLPYQISLWYQQLDLCAKSGAEEDEQEDSYAESGTEDDEQEERKGYAS